MENSSNMLDIVECPQWTENELYIYDRFKFFVEIVVGFIVSVLGIGFNLRAIIVLISMKSRQNIFNYLLICLLCADIGFLLHRVVYLALDHFITSDRWVNQLMPTILHPMYYIMLTLSIFLTIAISHERFIAIQYPIIHNQKMKSARSRRISLMMYLVVIILVTIIFHLPKFFEMEVVWKNTISKEDDVQSPNYHKYTRYFLRFSGVVTGEHRYSKK